MNYDNDIILYCNGEVVNDIKVTEILSDPANELFDDSFTYVATTHSAYTSYAKTNDHNEGAWDYDYSAITGAKDWTNTVKLTVNPYDIKTNIILGTDLVNYNAIGGHSRSWNRKDTNFAFRALSFDPNKYYLKVTGLIVGSKTNADSHTSIAVNSFNPDTSFIYGMNIFLCDKDGNNVTYNNYPLLVTPLTQIHDDDHDFNYFCAGYYFNDVQSGGGQRIYSGVGEVSAYKFNFTYTAKAFGDNLVNGNGLVYFPKEMSEIEYTRRQNAKYVEYENYVSFQRFYTGASVGNGASISFGFNLETAKQIVASTGMYFYWGNTLCMPIIKGSVTDGSYVTGADIETTDSDIKKYKETQGHVPVYPEPTDDYPDDPWGKIEWGGAYLGAGNFTNLWYCTANDLQNLRRWMNGLDIDHPLPEGFNPMNQILGLMQFPIGLGGTLTEELTMRTQANVTVHSGVMINKGFGDDLYYNLGSIDIPLRMKERGVPFLDYGSTIELYVPFCGVFQLDPQTVLGADLAVEMWLSPVTGECNCIVSVGRGSNRGPVAFGSGNMASDIPVTANGYGLYAAAAKEASLKRSELLFGGMTQGVQSLSAGANTANTLAIGEQIVGESIAGTWGAAGAAVGGASAAIGLGVALAQATHNIRALDIGMQHVKNSSGTSVSGSFSGTSAWHYPFQCYVKITRPRYKIPSNYAHTQGIPLIKAQPLSSCNGFTMCVGTDLSSVSATEIEKEQIAAFLNNGVIV